jgi:hypothetical protein
MLTAGDAASNIASGRSVKPFFNIGFARIWEEDLT